MKKIEENKKGYIERQSKQRAEMEEVYRRANEYQIKVADPSKYLLYDSQITEKSDVRPRCEVFGCCNNDSEELPEKKGDEISGGSKEW